MTTVLPDWDQPVERRGRAGGLRWPRGGGGAVPEPPDATGAVPGQPGARRADAPPADAALRPAAAPDAGRRANPLDRPPQEPVPAPLVRPWAPPARATSSAVVPAAALLAVLGTAGGWATARWGGVDPLAAAGLLWWVVSAVVLAVTARRAAASTAVVTLFLFLVVTVPLAAGATAYGLAQRAQAVLEDAFGDLGEQLGTSFEESFDQPVQEWLPPGELLPAG